MSSGGIESSLMALADLHDQLISAATGLKQKLIEQGWSEDRAETCAAAWLIEQLT